MIERYQTIAIKAKYCFIYFTSIDQSKQIVIVCREYLSNVSNTLSVSLTLRWIYDGCLNNVFYIDVYIAEVDMRGNAIAREQTV